MKLELKHLAPYLPYNLECIAFEEGKEIFKGAIYKLKTKHVNGTSYPIGCKVKSEKYPEKYKTTQFCNYEHCKPILRPLSDLLNTFVNKEGVEVDYFDELHFGLIDVNDSVMSVFEPENHIFMIDILPYSTIQKLLEWHFDIFGLIEKGLAIDINTL